MTLSVISLWQHFEVQMAVFVLDFWTFRREFFFLLVKVEEINIFKKKKRLCNIPYDVCGDVSLSPLLPCVCYFDKWQVTLPYSRCLYASSFQALLTSSHCFFPWHCNADASHKVAGNFHWRRFGKRNMKGGKGWGKPWKRWSQMKKKKKKRKGFHNWKLWARSCGKKEKC